MLKLLNSDVVKLPKELLALLSRTEHKKLNQFITRYRRQKTEARILDSDLLRVSQ